MFELQIITLELPSNKRYQENLDKLLEVVEENRNYIIVAPELFITGYDFEHLSTASKFSTNAIKKLKKACDSQIVITTMLIEEDGKFYNRAFIINRHKILYQQDKAKLFKLGLEHKYLEAGKSKKVKIFEINGVKYAILICFELRFKELWQQIEGADVIFITAQWGKNRKIHLDTLSRALAIINQCFVIVSNSNDIKMCGGSKVIFPNAEIIENKEYLLKLNLPLKEIEKIRRYIIID